MSMFLESWRTVSLPLRRPKFFGNTLTDISSLSRRLSVPLCLMVCIASKRPTQSPSRAPTILAPSASRPNGEPSQMCPITEELNPAQASFFLHQAIGTMRSKRQILTTGSGTLEAPPRTSTRASLTITPPTVELWRETTLAPRWCGISSCLSGRQMTIIKTTSGSTKVMSSKCTTKTHAPQNAQKMSRPHSNRVVDSPFQLVPKHFPSQ